ncbi:MAG: flagellar motor protein MotB [Candidatus Neomarinimicrobiota bacterium]
MAATKKEQKYFFEKGREDVEEGLPGWFGTFADMMTLLFAFFVLLAAISTIDPVKLQEMADSMGKSVGTKIKKESQAMSLSEIKKAAQEMVKKMEADPETGEKPVEVTTGPKGVTIGISSDISFQSGSAATKSGIIDILEKIKPTIQNSYFMVAIEGHTDSDPLPLSLQEKYPTNWELSGARAAAVVNLFINMGVDPTRLQAVGYGEFLPRDRSTVDIVSAQLINKLNSNDKQKARNRRVEITFLAP